MHKGGLGLASVYSQRPMNANQVFVYTESTGRIAFAHDNGKVLDVC
jgi:hypothetical protein